MWLKNLFQTKKKPHTVRSCGGHWRNDDGYEFLYEQINQEGAPAFAVYSVNAEEVFIRSTLEDSDTIYKPFKRLPWNPPTDAEPYESEEQLWQDVHDSVYRHWDHSEPAYHIMTAWIHASWLPELWLVTPYTYFFGALETGKSRGLEILAELSMRGWLASYVTVANLYRPVNMWKPSVFLDEAESYAKQPEITGLLNASYRKGSLVPRQRETKTGYVTDFFDCFTFKGIAGTRELMETLESRCIRFRMSRATRPLRLFIDKAETTHLRNQLLMYRFKKLSEKVTKVSSLGEGVPTDAYERFAKQLGSSRLAELFFPLVYLAPTDEIRNIIFDFAIELDKIKWEELTTSPESIVLRGIVEAYNQQKIHTGARIRIADIADIINRNLPLREAWTNRRVSATARRLGFIKTYVDGRVAYRYDEKLIERLKTDPRYKHCFDTPLPEQSLTSLPHLKAVDWNEVFKK